MIRVGITGGIGSGKSAVCKMFEALGIPVYNSDVRAKELMTSILKERIIELFGSESFNGNFLNRKFISDKVFNDRTLLAKLEAVVHPAVSDDFDKWAKSHSHMPYVVLESAILYESGFDWKVDKVIYVTAPVELRIARTMERDKASECDVRRRIEAQGDNNNATRADFVIENIDLKEAEQKVRQIHNILRNESN